MTVTNTKSYNEYTSTGTETSWTFTFDAQEVGQVTVLTIDENNVKTDVTASATIDLATKTVTYGPITSGWKLRIERQTTATQDVDLESQGPLLPQVLENALDKLTYIAQESKNLVADMQDTVVRDIKYAGDWAVGVNYIENQAVTRYGSLYIAKQTHTSDTSNGPTEDASNSYWAIAAIKGHTPVWRGTWTSGTAYNYLDMYEYNGASYICKQDHISSSITEPGVGANWTTYQDRMVLAVPADGSITTVKLADKSVTPPKIDSTQDYTFGQITTEKMTIAGAPTAQDVWLGGADVATATSNALTVLKKRGGPIFIFATGQSNIVGSNEDSGYDEYMRRTDPRVKVWTRYRQADGTFVWQWAESHPNWGMMNASGPDGSAPADQPPYVQGNNYIHAFAVWLAEQTGLDIRIVLFAFGSSGIVNWSYSSDPGLPSWKWAIGDVALAQCRNARRALEEEYGRRITVDICFWGQGENDTDVSLIQQGVATDQESANEWYAEQLRTWMAKQDEFRDTIPEGTPWLLQGLPHDTNFDDRNDVIYNPGRYGLENCYPVFTHGLPVYPASNGMLVHYSGTSLYRIGVERIPSAFAQAVADPQTLSEGADPWVTGQTLASWPNRPAGGWMLRDVLLPTTQGGLRAMDSAPVFLRGKVGTREIYCGAAVGIIKDDVTGMVVEAAGDVQLPPYALQGHKVTVVCNSANGIRVFPSVGGNINSKRDQGIKLPNKWATATFVCVNNETQAWRMIHFDNGSAHAWEPNDHILPPLDLWTAVSATVAESSVAAPDGAVMYTISENNTGSRGYIKTSATLGNPAQQHVVAVRVMKTTAEQIAYVVTVPDSGSSNWLKFSTLTGLVESGRGRVLDRKEFFEVHAECRNDSAASTAEIRIYPTAGVPASVGSIDAWGCVLI